jgi:subtilase family serine protease
MDQEMMQLKHELKEFVEKGQHILQKMEGSMGQRYYGMRGGQYGGYSGGQGGNFGNREPWMQGGYPQQEQWQNVDPRWFM